MKRSLVLLSSIALLGAAAHGVHALGKGNHGSSVSAVAQSTCVAVNPHNSNVTNHGQCVAQAAHAHSTGTPPAGASVTGTPTTGTKLAGTHGKAGKHHGKHGAKTHGKGHTKGAGKAKAKGTEVPEPTDTP